MEQIFLEQNMKVVVSQGPEKYRCKYFPWDEDSRNQWRKCSLYDIYYCDSRWSYDSQSQTINCQNLSTCCNWINNKVIFSQNIFNHRYIDKVINVLDSHSVWWGNLHFVATINKLIWITHICVSYKDHHFVEFAKVSSNISISHVTTRGLTA